MTHIVQDLLTLSRLDAGNAELNLSRFPFADAIQSVYRANALRPSGTVTSSPAALWRTFLSSWATAAGWNRS